MYQFYQQAWVPGIQSQPAHLTVLYSQEDYVMLICSATFSGRSILRLYLFSHVSTVVDVYVGSCL
jgi:hypothetical protein